MQRGVSYWNAHAFSFAGTPTDGSNDRNRTDFVKVMSLPLGPIQSTLRQSLTSPGQFIPPRVGTLSSFGVE